MPDWLWAYVAIGALVGFLSGMFGIGGGAVTVPALAFVFAAKGFPSDQALRLALGTSVATILFTSVSSVRSHHKRKAVNWRAFRLIAPGMMVGTFSGALLAGYLDVRVLAIIFTALMYFVGTQMLRRQVARVSNAAPGLATASAFGAVVGVFSSLTATGGAALVTPFLTKRGIVIHEAIGTSAAVGWPLAAAGTIGYVIGGWNIVLPEYSVGYVYLPALAGIAFASVLMAPVGAAVAHRLPGNTLRKCFAIALIALATGMLLKFF